MARRPREIPVASPQEIAPGVYCLEAGKGLMRSNVYFVRSGSSWALIDAAAAHCSLAIRQAAEMLFGEGTRPASILLSHDHPDHAGSARELAQMWGCPVYVHPDEMPLVFGDMATFRKYANPLDRWIVLPLLRLLGSRRAGAMLAEASFKDVACSLDPDADLPGLPDWQAVPTPGHTPGHIAFFRRDDRVLIAGDALVTVNLNSPWGLLRNTPMVSGPPWYTTWSWQAAKESAASLALLEPRVLAGGHGLPMTDSDTPERVRAFSERF